MLKQMAYIMKTMYSLTAQVKVSSECGVPLDCSISQKSSSYSFHENVLEDQVIFDQYKTIFSGPYKVLLFQMLQYQWMTPFNTYHKGDYCAMIGTT